MIQIESYLKNEFSLDYFYLRLLKFSDSNKDKNRLSLREHLALTIQKELPDITFNKGSLLDLSARPQLSGINVSISHTQTHGLFAITPSDIVVGVDIEQEDRVTKNIVQRVSHESEQITNHPASIWVLKEAGFKALSAKYNLNTISELRVLNLKSIKSPTHQRGNIYCKSLISHDHLASAWDFGRLKLGILLLRPQL